MKTPTPQRIDELGVPALFTEAARFRSWLDVEAALAGAGRAGHHPEAAGHEIVRKAHEKCLDLSAAPAGLASIYAIGEDRGSRTGAFARPDGSQEFARPSRVVAVIHFHREVSAWTGRSGVANSC